MAQHEYELRYSSTTPTIIVILVALAHSGLAQTNATTRTATTTVIAHQTITKEQLNYYKSLECIRDLVKFQDDVFPGEHNMVGLSFAVVHSQLQLVEYNFMLMHHYENPREMHLASGPQVNQEKCLHQLEMLNDRAARTSDNMFYGYDIELYRLLGTFGRLESGLLNGNVFWPGTYSECLRLKTRTTSDHNSQEVISNRYCVAKLKHRLWNNVNGGDKIALSLGICIPIVCDSSNFRNKFQLIQSLIEFNDHHIDSNNTFELSGLYCLPDEQSELRSIWQSSRAAVAFIFVVGWLTMVVSATIIYNRATISVAEKQVDIYPKLRVCRSLSIIHNLQRLFNTSVKEPTKATESAVSGSNMSSNCEKMIIQEDNKIVDLRCIDGIKVIAMCYVICGHVLLCSTIGLRYPQRAHSSGAFYMSLLVPAFAVNTFFAITGILTSYLVFKQNYKNKLITNPWKWIAFIAYRYLRIMPMYLLVVFYSKTLAKYTNAGPLWDYGTSDLSHRRRCEQESWLWTLMFGANFKKPLDHCIPGGWYLANDFQFSLVTPIFLFILHKNPILGKIALLLCIGLSYTANLCSVLFAELDDLRSIANFEPHGFKTYVTYLSHNYTRPYYRIPAYLSGLYMGFLLYTYERNRLDHFALINRSNGSAKSEQYEIESGVQVKVQQIASKPEPDWPEAFKRYCLPLSALFILINCITPYVSSNIPFGKFGARVGVALVIANYNLFFAVAVGCYILYTATAYTKHTLARILSAPLWKPLSRLGLCAMLINVEVMCYMFQGREYLHNWTTNYLMSTNLYSIVVIYLWSAIISVLFESPMTACLNRLLAYLSKRLGVRGQCKSKVA